MKQIIITSNQNFDRYLIPYWIIHDIKVVNNKATVEPITFHLAHLRCYLHCILQHIRTSQLFSSSMGFQPGQSFKQICFLQELSSSKVAEEWLILFKNAGVLWLAYTNWNISKHSKCISLKGGEGREKWSTTHLKLNHNKNL